MATATAIVTMHTAQLAAGSCSRTIVCSRHAPQVCQSQVNSRPPTTHVTGLYSFSELEMVKEVGEFSRNRGLFKKEGRELKQVVEGLCCMTEKQLQAVSVLCGEDIMDEIRVAIKLHGTNQARKRQQGWVCKLIRVRLGEDVIAKLGEAVELSKSSCAPYVDKDVQGLVNKWRQGLLADDQEVLQEVLSELAIATSEASLAPSAAAQGGEDTQDPAVGGEAEDGVAGDREQDTGSSSSSKLPSVRQLRALLRQCQVQAAAAAPGNGSEVSAWQREVEGGTGAARALGRISGPWEVPQSSATAEDLELQRVLAVAQQRSRKMGPGGQQPPANKEAGAKAQGLGQQAANSASVAAKRSRQVMRQLNAIIKLLAARTVARA